MCVSEGNARRVPSVPVQLRPDRRSLLRLSGAQGGSALGVETEGVVNYRRLRLFAHQSTEEASLLDSAAPPWNVGG